MNFLKLLIITIFMISGQYCFSGIDLTKLNFRYKYDPDAEVHYHYKVAVANDVATIFVRLDFNTNKINNPDATQIHYEIRKDYGSTESYQTDSLNSSHLILSENNSRYFRFNVPVVRNETLVVLQVTNLANNTQYIFDVPVDLPLQFRNPSIILMEKNRDIPVFSDYVHEQDSFRIVSLNKKNEPIYFFHYSKEFAPADPPMASQTTVVEKELAIDTSGMVMSNQLFSLPAKGLYLFQNDTTTAQGLSFIVKDEYFPQFVKAETLVEPIIYISTTREIRKIRDTDNKKKAMDTYWLELTKSPERAKKIIRDYYRQIELANYLFTTYKEGWKTDRGMIITLFGKPDAVFTNGDVEEWIYERRGSMSRISFNFIKIKNVFSDNHYDLVRNQGFDREWFRIVDQWRKGRQEI